jgi:hypothetical protein
MRTGKQIKPERPQRNIFYHGQAKSRNFVEKI